MRLDIDRAFYSYLHMTYRQKLEEAHKSIGLLADFLVKYDFSEKDRVGFYLNLAKLFIAADAEASLQECKAFNDIFGTNISYKSFKEFVANGNEKSFIESMNKFIDLMDDKAKLGACSFGLVFLSVDGHLSDKEKEVFNLILE